MEKAGKYEFVRKIGTGGFGTVYEGRDPFIKRRVAIKTCTSEDEEIRQRFFREAEIAGNLEHRNVTTVFDFGFEDGVPYLVQEYLTGEDLDHMIARREALSLERKLDILTQVATGLAYAHGQGVIHRDIKPGNIRLLEDGRVKIMDFGIAKLKDHDSGLTKTGTTVGTAAYLPPEQIRGEAVDHRADIFSFGVVAYELLSYKRPFDATTLSALLYQILGKEPATLREVWPEAPSRLVTLVRACLQKEPDRRCANFAEVGAELQAAKAEAAVDDTQKITRQQREAAVTAPATGSEVPVLDTAVVAPFEERARAALAAGDLNAAELEITLAARRVGENAMFHAVFDQLVQEIAAARGRREGERQRADKVETLLRRARQLQQPGGYDEARLLLQTALDLSPDNTTARSLLAATEAALAQEERVSELAADRDRRVADVYAALDADDLESAAHNLAAAEAAHPGAPAVAEARGRLQAVEREHNEQRVRAQVFTADEQAAAGHWEGARAALRAALAILPDDRVARLKLEEIETVLERQRVQSELQRRIASGSAGVEKLLDEGALERAARTLGTLEREFGTRPFEALRERVAGLESAQQAAQAAARAAQEQRRREEEAVAEQRRAAAREAEERRRGEERAATEAAARQRAQEREAAAADALVQSRAAAAAEVVALLGAGKLDKAEKALERTISKLGAAPAFLELRSRLRNARAEQTAAADRAREEKANVARSRAVEAAAGTEIPSGSFALPGAQSSRGLRWGLAGAAVAAVLGIGLWLAAGRGGDVESSDPGSLATQVQTVDPQAAIQNPSSSETTPASPASPASPTSQASNIESPIVEAPPPSLPPAVVPPASDTAPAQLDPMPARVAAIERRYGGGDRQGALAALLAERNAGASGRALLARMMREAEDGLSRARVTAVRAKAETLAPDLYLEADAKVTQAQRARDRGDQGRALNAWWAGAALYERAAQVAKAAPPPVVTLQGVEVTGETGGVVTRSGNSQSDLPPTVTPAQPPVVTPPVTPPVTTAEVVDETPRIRAALARYERAFEARDAVALKAIWPSLTNSDQAKLSAAFGGYRSLSMTMDCPSISIDGARAQAVCTVSQTIDVDVGKDRRDSARVTFSLQRSDAGWFITGRQ